MKKSLSPLFAVVVALSIAACGEKKDTTPPVEQPAPEPAPVVAAEPTPEPEKPAEPAPPPAPTKDILTTAAEAGNFTTLLASIDQPAAWQPSPAPNVQLMHLPGGPAVAAFDVGFVRVAAGTPFPPHRQGRPGHPRLQQAVRARRHPPRHGDLHLRRPPGRRLQDLDQVAAQRQSQPARRAVRGRRRG